VVAFPKVASTQPWAGGRNHVVVVWLKTENGQTPALLWSLNLFRRPLL
jgi:hypothetical protein